MESGSLGLRLPSSTIAAFLCGLATAPIEFSVSGEANNPGSFGRDSRDSNFKLFIRLVARLKSSLVLRRYLAIISVLIRRYRFRVFPLIFL